MPSRKSAIKRLRSDAKKRDRNRAAKSELKTHAKKIRALVAEGKAEEAKALLPGVVSRYAKAAKRGNIHRNTASRKVSRLAKLASLPAKGGE